MKFLAPSIFRRAACLGAPVTLFSVGAAAVKAATTYAPVNVSAAVAAAGGTAAINTGTSVGLNIHDQVVGLTGSNGGSEYVFNYSSGAGTATVLSPVQNNANTGFVIANNAGGEVVGSGSVTLQPIATMFGACQALRDRFWSCR